MKYSIVLCMLCCAVLCHSSNPRRFAPAGSSLAEKRRAVSERFTSQGNETESGLASRNGRSPSSRLARVQRAPAGAPNLNAFYDFLLSIGLNKLCKMMKQADIEDLLLSVGPFTLFAPSDDSFTFLPGSVWQSFRKDNEKRREFIMHHVVPGTVNSANVKNDLVIDAARGPPVRCNLYNGGKDWTVSGSKVVQPDLRHGEFTVQIIDDFLYPPATMNNLDYIRANFDNFHRMLAMADPNNYISEGTFTIFVPGDEAFKALPEFLLESIFTNNSLLQSVLLNHVVPSTYYQIGLPLGSTLTSLDHNQLRFKTRRGLVMVNGIPIVRPDISVTNGVIHIVNRVLLPPNVFEDCNCLPTTPRARTTSPPQTTTPLFETIKTTSTTVKRTRSTPKISERRKQRTTPVSLETATQTTEVPSTTESYNRARRPSYAPLTLPSFESSRLKPTKYPSKSKTTTSEPPADVDTACEDENGCVEMPCPDGKDCPLNDQTNSAPEPNEEQPLENNDEKVPDTNDDLAPSEPVDDKEKEQENGDPPTNESEQIDDPDSQNYPQDEPFCKDKGNCKDDKTPEEKTTPRPTPKDKNVCPGPNCPKECTGKDCASKEDDEQPKPTTPQDKSDNKSSTCSPGSNCPESETEAPSKNDKPAESLCPIGKFCPDVESVQTIDCPKGSDCSLQKPKPSDCPGKSCPEINKVQPCLNGQICSDPLLQDEKSPPNDQTINKYDKCNGVPCSPKPTPRYPSVSKPNFVPAGRRKPTAKPPGFIRIPYGPLFPKSNTTSTTVSEGNNLVTSPEVVIISRATTKAPVIPESDSQLASVTLKAETSDATSEPSVSETTKLGTDLTTKLLDETTVSTVSSHANEKVSSSLTSEVTDIFSTASPSSSDDSNNGKVTSMNTEQATRLSDAETPRETVPTTMQELSQPETTDPTTKAAQTSTADDKSDPAKPNTSSDVQNTEPNVSTKSPSPSSTTFETKGPFDFSDEESLTTILPPVLETTENSAEDTTTNTLPSHGSTQDKTPDTSVSNTPTSTDDQKTSDQNSDPTVPPNSVPVTTPNGLTSSTTLNPPITTTTTTTTTTSEVYMQTTADSTSPEKNNDPSTSTSSISPSTAKDTMLLIQNDNPSDQTDVSETTQHPTEMSTKTSLPVKDLQENTESLPENSSDVYKSSETVPQKTTVPISSTTQNKETTADANNSVQDKSTTQAESPSPCSNSQKTTSNSDVLTEVTKVMLVATPEDNPNPSSTPQVTTPNEDDETQKQTQTIESTDDPVTTSAVELSTSKRFARTTAAPDRDSDLSSPNPSETTESVTTQESTRDNPDSNNPFKTSDQPTEFTEQSSPITSVSETTHKTTPVTVSEPPKSVSTSQEPTQTSTTISEEEMTTLGIDGRRPIRKTTTPSVEDQPVNDQGAPDDNQSTDDETEITTASKSDVTNETKKSSTTVRPRPSIVIIPYVTTSQPSPNPQETSTESESTTNENSARATTDENPERPTTEDNLSRSTASSATTPQNEQDKKDLTSSPYSSTQPQTTDDNGLYTETTPPSPIPLNPEYQPSKPEVEELTPEFLDPPNSIDDVLNRPNLVIGRTKVTFHVVLRLFKNVGLTDILLRKGPYTLCVPTDAAFSRLPNGYLQRVQSNGDLLRKILLHHVITSQVPVSSLRNNHVIRTYQGQPVIINVHNAGKLVLFGGSRVLGTTRTSNGVLYIMDRVLSDVPQYNLLRAIRNNPELEHFYDYVMNSPLKQILRARGPFTVVAPTNDAFNQLSSAVLNMLATNQTALEKVVYNHLVPGAYFSAGLQNGLVLPTPRGGTLRFTISTDGLQVNNARVLHPDISAGNGVLHVVDQVLLSSPDIFEKLSQANNPNPPYPSTSPLKLSELATGLGVDTFIGWFENSELIEKISDGEPYTILAPTDIAVEALPPTTFRSLNENPKMRLQVLSYHVVPGFLQPNVISNEDTIPTLLPGKDVRFNWYKNETDLLVSGARLGLDRRHGQIVIQVINKVLYPPTGDIMNTISKSPLLRDLTRAVRMTGLDKELTGSSGPYTLFAPTQEAFRNMPQSEYKRMFSSPEEMKHLLMRHLSAGTLFSTGVSSGMVIPSRNGEELTVTTKPQCIVVDGVNVLYSDITATNGVVHVLNHLL